MWIYMAQFEMRKLPNNLLLLENHSFEIFYTFYYYLLCLLKIIPDFAIHTSTVFPYSNSQSQTIDKSKVTIPSNSGIKMKKMLKCGSMAKK